jgi:hypothetical protein
MRQNWQTRYPSIEKNNYGMHTVWPTEQKDRPFFAIVGSTPTPSISVNIAALQVNI